MIYQRNPFVAAARGYDSIGNAGYDHMGRAVQPMKAALAARFLAAMCLDGGAGGRAAAMRSGQVQPGLVQQPGFRAPIAPGPMAQPFAMPHGLSMQDQLTLANGEAILIGLDSGTTTVPAGGTATISDTPQEACMPIRMICSDSDANNFALLDLKIGNRSLLSTVGSAVPMAFFMRDARTADLRSFPVAPGTQVSITVRNRTLGALPITVGIEATSLNGLGLGPSQLTGWGYA
jgi:hypothetical protein